MVSKAEYKRRIGILVKKNAQKYRRRKAKISLQVYNGLSKRNRILNEASLFVSPYVRRKLRVESSRNRHTKSEWEWVLSLYGGKCAFCGSIENIQKDHIFPLKRGGSDGVHNLQPLCRSCNFKKSAKLVSAEDFIYA